MQVGTPYLVKSCLQMRSKDTEVLVLIPQRTFEKSKIDPFFFSITPLQRKNTPIFLHYRGGIEKKNEPILYFSKVL